MNDSHLSALCLTGGGVTGALYQVGALSALEDLVEGLGFDIFVGTSSGASLAAGLAGGIPVQRLYRALIDPADNFFPLERQHIVSLDLDEWRRTIGSGFSAMRHSIASLVARTPAPLPSDLWEQLDRFYDALPAGLFTLDRYERFLSDFFFRRGVPNSFRAIGRQLLITAVGLDSGDRVIFGSDGFDHVPISLACSASMALPLFFSPVRVDDRYYIDGGIGRINDIEIATSRGAGLVVVLNPNVPLATHRSPRGVPTGYGPAESIRDKGLMWVYNQSVRAGVHSRYQEALERARSCKDLELLVLQPDPSEAVRFMHNAASFAARRDILEWSYRTTRETVRKWAHEHPRALERRGMRLKSSSEAVVSDSRNLVMN